MNALKMFFVGVGGQGSLLAARLLGEAALRDNVPVVMSEIHGMSQRGGVVESVVVMGGPKSPMIKKGSADLMVAFEPNEALRALPYCSPRTTVIINLRPVVPSSVSLGLTAYVEPAVVVDSLRRLTARIEAFDATAIAETVGTAKAANVVILGAIAALGMVPVAAATIRAVIADFVPQRYLHQNLEAFDKGLTLPGSLPCNCD